MSTFTNKTNTIARWLAAVGVTAVVAAGAVSPAQARHNNSHRHAPHAYDNSYGSYDSNGYRNNIPQRSYDVYDTRGRYVGSDPDPDVRFQLQHDPTQGD